jgi:asparagine synthase (glutamine-hydrolysing)
MCGIAGRLNLDGRPVDRQLVSQMVRLLSHRGPDDEGVYVSGPIGLANRRLSIIDLGTGRQPIANEDETVWVVLNGEIYNFVELRQMLEKRGHRFSTHTDTEVIVHLYEDFGVELLSHLRGMFAFAVWDAPRRRLFLARDRLGEKPLFYAFVPGRTLAFGSELKSLLVDPDADLRLDLVALDQYFTLGYIPAPRTIFGTIAKLPAGHYLTYSESSLKVVEYWDVPIPPAGGEDPLDEEKIHDRMRDAVRLQLRSDVPLGAFLSGGIDSTTIVATMAEILGNRIVTTSVGFAEEEHSELRYARIVAETLGTDHREEMVELPSADVIEKLCWHFDEPFGDSSAVPTWAVSRAARRHVKVALSGDGGDELFGGYARHTVERREHLARRWGPIVATGLSYIGAAIPIPFPGRNALARLRMPPDQACALKFRFETRADRLKAIYSPALRAELGSSDPLEPFRRLYQRAKHADPLNRILYVDLKTYLADDILVKVDRMSMAHGLEVRAPFLDPALVETVARLSGPVKVRAGVTKPLLRSMLEGRLPGEAWDRQKHGFTAPVSDWLRDGLRSHVEELITSTAGAARDLFDTREIRRLWQDHSTGRANHDHEFWMLLMFDTWQRMIATIRPSR